MIIVIITLTLIIIVITTLTAVVIVIITLTLKITLKIDLQIFAENKVIFQAENSMNMRFGGIFASMTYTGSFE